MAYSIYNPSGDWNISIGYQIQIALVFTESRGLMMPLWVISNLFLLLPFSLYHKEPQMGKLYFLLVQKQLNSGDGTDPVLFNGKWSIGIEL